MRLPLNTRARANLRDVHGWFSLYEAGVAVLGIFLCGLVGAVLATRAIVIPWADQVPVPLRLVLPAVAGSVAGAALGNRTHLLTRIAARRTRRWRAAWIAVLSGLTLVAWAPAFIVVAESFGAGEMLRNLIGFLGMGFAAASLFRARLAWVGPLPFALAGLFGGAYRSADGTVAAHWWAWALADQRTPASWIVAVSLFVAGAALFVQRDGKP